MKDIFIRCTCTNCGLITEINNKSIRTILKQSEKVFHREGYTQALEDLIIQVNERLNASSDDDYYEWGRTNAFNRVIEIAEQLKKSRE